MLAFGCFPLLFISVVVIMSIIPFNSSQKDFCELFGGIEDYYKKKDKDI